MIPPLPVESPLVPRCDEKYSRRPSGENAGPVISDDDWDTYDRVMREEGRVAVLVTPTRVYGNA